MLQVYLLTAQGIILIAYGINDFNIWIWVALLGLALAQVVMVFKMPKKIDAKDLQVDRKQMLGIRVVATVPYALIVLALIVVGS